MSRRGSDRILRYIDRKSMSFEGEQQKIEHDGSRNNFSAYISMVWPDQKLMYDFYDSISDVRCVSLPSQ